MGCLKATLLKHRRLLAASVALAALAAAALTAYSLKGQYLLLTNEQSGRVLFCEPAALGSEFAVSFTHSVNKSPVTEYYTIANGQILLQALRYYTFGAGMPGGPEQGQTMRFEEGGAIIIEGFKRPMPRLVYNVGRSASHTLHWQGRDIPLNTLDAPGEPILFSVIVYPRILPALRIYPAPAKHTTREVAL
ncbi:MAG: DUF1850 domain-containing protein [Clostridiales bacterium]|nr:DUF1850 domain-containing protein [Clostridiales bacterium]